ncbi:YjjG family noncanonical pyrimidine nucleotidase [Dysgonomonas sp. Marseille-P4677]|uniref:YjjG family noncanonical pyrimidine nucleotidase n=1 Tax=Dysgonomonas sp. Marseille-P4677 TaxID=2364790 RepID=UPI001913D98F|nr:YjjG family noncanonical pyrimidine nucleotidase [Dysgonomonas sp. Marseille-P4677]MBK5720496.1 YjjG family noncanonical pyrimidine nucleotidase [Dysgonomonas sp. Marseille-P4677]
MKYTDILLDLDDTLIDTATNTKETVKEIYRDYLFGKYFKSFDEFFTFYNENVSKLWIGYNNGDITKEKIQEDRFTDTLKHIDGFNKEKIRVINKDYIERIVKKEALIEGALDLLDYLKPKYKIHILSNGFTEMQYQKMESARLDLSYFDHIILSDIVGVNKPHPDIFSYSLDRIGATRSEVIMIGDNLSTDIYGAYNSGINQIWYNPENKLPEKIKPTYMVKKLYEIKNIL